MDNVKLFLRSHLMIDDSSIITINYSIQYITLTDPPQNVWPFILQSKQYGKNWFWLSLCCD